MDLEVLGDVNWLATIVAALVYFALGALWYAPPVLGKAWMRAVEWSPDDDEENTSPAFYLMPLITCALTALALAMLAQATATDTFGEGLTLGLVVGIGVAAAVVFVTGVFDPKRRHLATWFGVTAGYHVVGITIAAVIVALWT